MCSFFSMDVHPDLSVRDRRIVLDPRAYLKRHVHVPVGRADAMNAFRLAEARRREGVVLIAQLRNKMLYLETEVSVLRALFPGSETNSSA